MFFGSCHFKSAGGGNRTRMEQAPLDFESSASTCFTTPAVEVFISDLREVVNKIRTHLKNASEGPWRCCGSAQNAHILSCMLRFFAEPRLALNPDPHF
jgi:hypothetical protein